MTLTRLTIPVATEPESTGYLNPEYAQSLAEFGTPIQLPRSHGQLLVRPISSTGDFDAMGCYPLFACRHWSRLCDDLDQLGGNLVSVTLVADPFGAYQEEDLHQCFDHVTAFKQRFITELGDDPATIVSKHHRYYARQALKKVRVETCHHPGEYLDRWCRLYDHLARRHGLSGVHRFSRTVFQKQLEIKGMVMFGAFEGAHMTGAHLWMIHDHVAYSHLAAYDEKGYAANVAYALYWHALQRFHEGCFGCIEQLDLGASAGTSNKSDDGLSRFKGGWSNGSRPTWLCGRILDHDRYRRHSEGQKATGVTYFPAYRQSEFKLSSGYLATTHMTAEPVYLRRLQLGDLERTHRWHNDASLYDTLVGQFRPVSVEAERQWLEQVSAAGDDQINLAICLKTHEHVGNIYLRSIDHAAGSAELHIFIASEEHRSKGYAQQAVNKLLDHAFTVLKLDEVHLHVLEKNTPAIRCYEKCGFHRKGILRGHVVKAGQSQDVVVMIRFADPA